VLWVTVVCIATGLLVYRLFDQLAALVLSLGGIAVFVIVAWYEARPEQGGKVGRPDISWPWRNRRLGE
jgi:hypothetical protein